MQIINTERGIGKTSFLINISCFSNIPIVCANKQRKDIINDMAKDYEMSIPEPIIADEFLEDESLGKKLNGVLIDDLGDVLSVLLKTNINTVASSCNVYTLEREE